MNIYTSHLPGHTPTERASSQRREASSKAAKREAIPHSTTGGSTFDEYARGNVPSPDGLGTSKPAFQVGWKDVARSAVGMGAGLAVALYGGPLTAPALGAVVGLSLARASTLSGVPAIQTGLLSGGMGLLAGMASNIPLLAVNLGIAGGAGLGAILPNLLRGGDSLPFWPEIKAYPATSDVGPREGAPDFHFPKEPAPWASVLIGAALGGAAAGVLATSVLRTATLNGIALSSPLSVGACLVLAGAMLGAGGIQLLLDPGED